MPRIERYRNNVLVETVEDNRTLAQAKADSLKAAVKVLNQAVLEGTLLVSRVDTRMAELTAAINAAKNPGETEAVLNIPELRT